MSCTEFDIKAMVGICIPTSLFYIGLHVSFQPFLLFLLRVDGGGVVVKVDGFTLL